MLRKKLGILLLGLAIVAVAGVARAQELAAPNWEENFPRITGRTVRLKWDKVAGAEGYNIYRDGELVGKTGKTKTATEGEKDDTRYALTTTYSDSKAQVGDNRYAIAAVAGGVEGPRSVERSITLKPMKARTTSDLLVNISFLVFIVASLVYAAYNLLRKEGIKKNVGYAGSALMLAGLLMMTVAILLRWRDAGRPPFSNMYESLILFAWSIALIYLVLELVYKIRVAGVIAAVLTVVSIAAASFFDNTIEALVPALQSDWLAWHVLTCFVGYAAFAVSAGASLLYLFLKLRGKASKPGTEDVGTSSSEILRAMQSFNYEAVRFGFLFLGVGIITGAVWANEAWGTYWSWDPKETWSLITWIIYAILIHFKYVSGRFGIKDLNTFNAVCSIIGFLAVIFTYFGVNFILSGLHSYA
jgi:cytochrome c-type biogenesis protein CcsB